MTASGKPDAAFRRLSEILPEVLRQFRQPADEGLLNIWNVWEAAVGPLIAEQARPSAFKGRLLIVSVSNSTSLHHLQFLKADLIHQLNQALGRSQIDDIRFKVSSLRPVERDAGNHS